jgi:uncharacterized membrane protein YfcA
VQSVVTVAVLGPVPPPWPLVVATVVGTAAGTWIAPRVPAAAARAGVLAVAGLGGAALVLANV